MSDDFDDDAPIVFKRPSSSSKPNPVRAELTKPSSQRPDGQLGTHSSNGQNSSSRMPSGKQTSMRPPTGNSMRSPLTSPKASASSGKISPATSAKPSASLDSQSRQSSRQSTPTITKEEPDSDSDDQKPLSARMKGSCSNNNKGQSSTSSMQAPKRPAAKDSAESSDDEKPIAMRMSQKSTVGTSSSKPIASGEKKPISSQAQQNGFASREISQKSPVMVSKRPLEKTSSTDQSLGKKPKVSNVPPSSTAKHSVKAEGEDDDDHIPISQRIKKPATGASGNKSASVKGNIKPVVSTKFKKTSKQSNKVVKKSKYSKSIRVPPGSGDGQKKWTTLEHSGVIFPPPYTPHGIKMLYKGKPVDLTPEQEEVATMYAVMKDTDYLQKQQFRDNFWNDWKKILGSKHLIQKLEHCDFTPIYDWYQEEKEKKKQMTKEEKNALKEEKMKLEEKYMWAVVDGVKEKVGNFRVEPPGLFRGRGEHPKMGKLKKRIRPSDITINIGKGVPVPECPIPGQKWKEVRHDNTVTWLAFWNDPINPKEFKYVFLAASSSLKGQSDKEKYEKARMLKDYIHNIRDAYTRNFNSKDASKRQIAVATYLIDKLALRAGNEKDDDEADTVGCCTLKVEKCQSNQPKLLGVQLPR